MNEPKSFFIRLIRISETKSSLPVLLQFQVHVHNFFFERILHEQRQRELLLFQVSTYESGSSQEFFGECADILFLKNCGS